MERSRPYDHSTALTTTITGLTNGQSYDVQVRASSSAGDSELVNRSHGHPALQAPDAPAKPTVTPGDSKLEVEWTKPAENGAPITDYDVQYRVTTSSADADWDDQDHTDATLTTTITGLTNGQSYDVRVRATNSAGTSDWSTAATGTPALLPDAPAKPTVTPGDSKLEVEWTKPAENGASITDYDVQYRVTTSSADADWNDQDHTDATLTTTITGLTNGQSYDVRVRATNSAGTSGWSTAATGTPAAPA